MADESVNLKDADAVVELFQHATKQMRENPLRIGSAVRLPAEGRLLATGDLHDNTLHLQKVIAAADLDAGPDRHVVLHELIHGDKLINGLDFSHRMLAAVAQLVLRYPGQVHPMLANHEIAQLTRKGVSKGAGDSVVLFNEALEYVYSDDWETVAEAIDEFFRAMPLAVLSEGGVCCAHSLPNARLMRRFDADVLGRALSEDDYLGQFGAAYLMCWGRAYSDESAAELAEKWNVRLFVLGHQHVESGVEQRGENIVVLNSDHLNARIAAIDLADVPSAERLVADAVALQTIAAPAQTN